MRNTVLIAAAVLAFGLSSCGDPETIVEPFAAIGMTHDAPSAQIGVVWTF